MVKGLAYIVSLHVVICDTVTSPAEEPTMAEVCDGQRKQGFRWTSYIGASDWKAICRKQFNVEWVTTFPLVEQQQSNQELNWTKDSAQSVSPWKTKRNLWIFPSKLPHNK